MNVEKLAAHIRWAEGSGPYHEDTDTYHPYRDSVGKLTIGHGHNLDDRGLDADVVEHQLRNDIHHVLEDCRRLDYWDSLDPVRQLVVADLVFNLGLPRWKSFVKANAALRLRDYKLAATEMEDSRWYRQTGRRARKLSRSMRSGVWEDSE